MEKYFKAIADGYSGYWNYFIGEILQPSWHNYFYWLLGASSVIYLLEVFFPWRKNQALIREHFWLDIFYLFWNYFLFSLVVYNALSMVAVEGFNDFLGFFRHCQYYCDQSRSTSRLASIGFDIYHSGFYAVVDSSDVPSCRMDVGIPQSAS